MLALTSSSPPGFWHYFWFPVLPEERMSRFSSLALPTALIHVRQSERMFCFPGILSIISLLKRIPHDHMTRTAAPKVCCRTDWEPNSTYHRDFYKSLSFIQRLQRNLELQEIEVAIKPYLINSPVLCCCISSPWFTVPQLCRHSFL